jgi:hypothetical protein
MKVEALMESSAVPAAVESKIAITLSESEERLVEALRALPREAADQAIVWATRLNELAKGKDVDWSDAWNDDDLTDARRASSLSHDAREPG